MQHLGAEPNGKTHFTDYRKLLERNDIDNVTWSPDGQTLAFSSDMDPSGAFYIYTISSKGGKPECLDATKSAWPNEIMWQPMVHDHHAAGTR